LLEYLVEDFLPRRRVGPIAIVAKKIPMRSAVGLCMNVAKF
jgi:hypothetical protein